MFADEIDRMMRDLTTGQRYPDMEEQAPTLTESNHFYRNGVGSDDTLPPTEREFGWYHKFNKTNKRRLSKSRNQF